MNAVLGEGLVAALGGRGLGGKQGEYRERYEHEAEAGTRCTHWGHRHLTRAARDSVSRIPGWRIGVAARSSRVDTIWHFLAQLALARKPAS